MSRFLFLDDRHIAQMPGLTLRPHAAEKHPHPVMVREHPWEAARVQVYGRSVIFDPDARKLRMYYIAMHGPRWPWIKVNGRDLPGHATLPAYAESDDGVRWTKPALGQRSFDDIADTNLLDFNRGMSFEAGVLHDPRDPDPARRYKLFYWDQAALLLPDGRLEYQGWGYDCVCRVIDERGNVIHSAPYTDWGIDVAFSPDGVRWTRHPNGPRFRCYSDTGQSVLFDERIGRYVAFGRFNLTRLARGGMFNVGRSVARVTSADFLDWSEPELVLAADGEDPPGLQINSMPVDLYEGLYIGQMELFVQGAKVHAGDVQLAVSRDGENWSRVADRFAFVTAGPPGEWDDGGGIRPGSALIPRGERVLMYYGGGRHGTGEGIGLASWRRDGFVSLSAGPAGGELLTAPLTIGGAALRLNVDARDGEAVVQLCNHQGVPDPDVPPSHPIRGDSTAAVVTWPADVLGQRVGQLASLRIRLSSAELYSFWFE